MEQESNLRYKPPSPHKKDYRIGAVGAGFVMRDVHLVAYQKAGYHVEAITSQDVNSAREAAGLRGISKVYETTAELIADPAIQVLDIAVPPHCQPGIIEHAVSSRKDLRGILAQKPLALKLRDARRIVELCDEAGIPLAVNQNMRYDQSIRALRTLLSRGDLGEPVLGTIEMRAIPHWQTWLQQYGRLTLLNMSIHHLDCFRFLFGDPESVYASVRTDPRTTFTHHDGIALYILEYANGMRASAWDDVWSGPVREGAAPDIYIRWRVEGTEGLAEGTIGWPGYPNAVPSTIRYSTRKRPGCWLEPHWEETWFPDAFAGPMGELFDSITEGREPCISGRDNLSTMALVEACYRSVDLHRPVKLVEVEEECFETRAH
ncbi:MAG TPA: Gfo/Idh/MocA family oxidoreductase [Bryobacteraceae bacterium]|nr:Gfo/Idh/MocA family oxidoreductase [Bryobacteraceae bacterium]